MRFFLSHINMPEDTIYPEREFETMDQIVDYINEKHPDCVSFDIIVLMKAKTATGA